MSNNIFFKNRTVEKYDMTKEVLKNPLMGFVPSAEAPSLVADNSLIYVDITMRGLEPEEGSFDFDTIEEENQLSRWRKEGKHAVLRLTCDYPGPIKHLDIPDWLFEKTGGAGVYYDNAYGKGYSPDYTNSVFIEYHKLAVEALGKRYGDDTFISFIQLGSLGHWGEWHVYQKSGLPPIPNEEIRSFYVNPYIDAFPNAKILMRRPFKTARGHNFGLYNDMVGHFQSSVQWMKWINYGGPYEQTLEQDALVPMPGFWKKAPVGGEFTSALPMSNLLTVNLTDTLKMLTEAHYSFLGPKVPHACAEEERKRYKEGLQQVLKSVGYRIGITKSVWSESYTMRVKVTLIWENRGVAPLYWDWPVFLFFLDHEEKILDKYPVNISLTHLIPGKKLKSVTLFQLNDRRRRAESVYVGIQDPMTGNPSVNLVSTQEKLGALALIKH